jgi:hypothetical protein
MEGEDDIRWVVVVGQLCCTDNLLQVFQVGIQ